MRMLPNVVQQTGRQIMRTQAQVNMEVNESVQKKSNQGGNNFKRT